MLDAHAFVPHVRVRTLDGREVDYASEVWQHRNLLLVSIADPDDAATRRFVQALSLQLPVLDTLNAAYVVTADEVPGPARPGVLIADRWGEIQTITHVTESRWPPIDDLVATLSWLEMRCPECEGEAR